MRKIFYTLLKVIFCTILFYLFIFFYQKYFHVESVQYCSQVFFSPLFIENYSRGCQPTEKNRKFPICREFARRWAGVNRIPVMPRMMQSLCNPAMCHPVEHFTRFDKTLRYSNNGTTICDLLLPINKTMQMFFFAGYFVP